MMNMSASSISKNSLPDMAYRNIHVLLVEHDITDHDNISSLLNYFSYKVTSEKLASTALSILSKGKADFDLVMVNINSPLGFQILEDATKMKLLVIFMSNEDDDATTKRALEQGALLCIRKPLSVAILGSLWQLVMSEKARRSKEFENYVLVSDHDFNAIGFEEKHDSEAGSNSDSYRVGYKRKAWTEWTVDLHRKFMAAATYLGEGRCYPKDILEIMNVPGLTRMQVASHLQKCRNYKWLPPNDRKPKAVKNKEKPRKRVITNNPPRAKKLRFGIMPFGQTIQGFQDAMTSHRQDITTQTAINPLLDHCLCPFAADNNMGLEEEVFLHGDYQATPAPNPNFFPIVDSDEARDLPDFRQQLEMDFSAEWEAFVFDGEEGNQTSAAADNQWFNEKDGTEEGKMWKNG